jgi:hypothetical protein
MNDLMVHVIKFVETGGAKNPFNGFLPALKPKRVREAAHQGKRECERRLRRMHKHETA